MVGTWRLKRKRSLEVCKLFSRSTGCWLQAILLGTDNTYAV